MSIAFTPIGTLRTGYQEKFGTPRQSGLVPAAKGVLRVKAEFAPATAGLEAFSHIWLLFLFDRHLHQPWRPKITPPRPDLEKVGVFASRSPHRPNPIGMSAVRLERIERLAHGEVEIHCAGVDILDGTAVIDIKPYLPYADSVPGAHGGWAENAPARHPVEFAEAAFAKVSRQPSPEEFRVFLEQTLALDPRPRSQKETMPFAESAGKVFRFRLAGFDIEWQIQGEKILVLDLLTCP